MPKVSVIMPSYNTATLIAEALDSVFAQDYSDFEVIVINDGSPDTPELERVLEPYRDRIVYLKQENRRACGARNNGINHARGEYVAFLDSDDSWMPTYLRTQMGHLEKNPSLDMIYCDCLIYGGGAQSGKTFMQTCPSDGPVNFESLLLEMCQVPISGTIVRRELLIAAGGFDERLPMCDDYEMWLRLAYRGSRIVYHPGVLARLRIGRPNSLSASEARMLGALLTILSKVKTDWNLSKEQQILLAKKFDRTTALFDLERGKEFLKQNEFNQARTLLEQANGQLRRGKLKLTLFGLRVAPALTAFAARGWDRFRLRFVG
ncbi:MAG: putative glycosyltransferase [Acidobacteriaceae bacterium]|nr:putative glycosyltransferase [Acidobacteriaceae bacterium]